jgi:alkylation response protein AidB-like acyl-CoA dehydrogenase
MEDQEILRDTARRFLSERAPVAQLRRLRDTRDEAGFSTELWSDFAEMGYPGMLVPEELGGSGLGLSEAALVMEQIGHTLCASPFLATGVVAVTALLHAGNEAQQAHWLPRLAEGKSIVTLAVDERAKHCPEHIETRATRDGEGWRLDGAKCFVLEGHVADLLIVAARTSGSNRDRHGISLFLVPRTACGVTVDRTIMVDSHNCARVTLQKAQVSSDMLLGSLDGGAQTLDAALTSGRVAAAAELLGISDEVFERTIGYLKERRQFDRPIGEFQGLQHRAAKLYIEIELSRAALLVGLQKLDAAPGVAASRAVAVAKAKCGNTAMLAVQEGVQMHGGIAMTDEFEIGFFMKRARVLHELFGDANFHMNRVALSGRY